MCQHNLLALLLSNTQHPAALCPLHRHLPDLAHITFHCGSTMTSSPVPHSAFVLLSVPTSQEKQEWTDHGSLLPGPASSLSPSLISATRPALLLSGRAARLCATPSQPSCPSVLPKSAHITIFYTLCSLFLFPHQVVSSTRAGTFVFMSQQPSDT